MIVNDTIVNCYGRETTDNVRSIFLYSDTSSWEPSPVGIRRLFRWWGV